MNLKQRLADGAINNLPSLNLIIVYEDFSMGSHALNVCNRVFPADEQRPSFDTRNVWKFDLLEIAKFRDMAAAGAVAADLVIISVHASRALPAAVKRWMESWVERRMNIPGALVILLDDAKKVGSHAARMEDYLQICAFRASMDFFVLRKERWGDGKKENRPEAIELELPKTTEFANIIRNVPWRLQLN